MAFDATPAVPRARPATVTAAVYLLYLAAVLGVISSILTFTTIGPTRRAIADAYRDVQGGGSAATVTAAVITAVAVIGLLFSLGYAVLGYFVGRGSNAARIVTWVVAGLSVCCGGGGVFGNALGGSFGGGSPNGGPDSAEVQRRVRAALPSWSPAVSLTLGIISLLISLAVIVLLLLPASNEYFRKQPAQVWEPPAPYVPPTAPPPTGPPPSSWPPPAAGPPSAGPPPPSAEPPPPAAPPA
jgi:hypothetical protein